MVSSIFKLLNSWEYLLSQHKKDCILLDSYRFSTLTGDGLQSTSGTLSIQGRDNHGFLEMDAICIKKIDLLFTSKVSECGYWKTILLFMQRKPKAKNGNWHKSYYGI